MTCGVAYDMKSSQRLYKEVLTQCTLGQGALGFEINLKAIN